VDRLHSVSHGPEQWVLQTCCRSRPTVRQPWSMSVLKITTAIVIAAFIVWISPVLLVALLLVLQ
jgi:hypothetical protein